MSPGLGLEGPFSIYDMTIKEYYSTFAKWSSTPKNRLPGRQWSYNSSFLKPTAKPEGLDHGGCERSQSLG